MDRFRLRTDQQVNKQTDLPVYNYTINDLEYDIEFPFITPEVIDYSMLKWFEVDNPIYITEKEDKPKKIKSFFSTIERWAMMQYQTDIRDENGTLILPIISIRRNDIETIDERTVPSDDESTANLTLYIREYINPTTQKKEYIVNNEKSNRKNIVEVISIQPPKIVKITYNIIFWASFIQDLNIMIQHMIQKFGKHHAIYYSEKLFFDAFLNGISNASNDEDITGSERIYKTNFDISVEAPLIDISSIETFRTYQNISTDVFTGESVIDGYTSAKLYSSIDWRNPYKLER